MMHDYSVDSGFKSSSPESYSNGLANFLNDVESLPARYHGKLDPEKPEHCAVEIEGVLLEIRLDDLSVYPIAHTARIWIRVDDLKMSHAVPLIQLSSMDLSGDLSDMILTISWILSGSRRTPAPYDLDEEMTDVENDYEDIGNDDEPDDENWQSTWDNELAELLKKNCNAVIESDVELLHDIDKSLEGLIWSKTPIADLIEYNVFTQAEADTWGLSNELSLWILFQIGEKAEDFTISLRQADHNDTPRSIVRNLILKNQILCVLETYIRKTVIQFVENTFLLVGRTILERLGDISKYCVICGDKSVDIPSVKPFCCSNHLCQYQYMYVDINGCLEDCLINEPLVSQLLIILAYEAARHEKLSPYPDCFTGEDEESIADSKQICRLLNKLPSVAELVKLAKVPNGLQTLKDTDQRLLPLLRWIILSNTAHIKKLEKPDQMIAGLAKHWLQFKMTISTAEKEATFQHHKDAHEGKTIFAFHGSPLVNWHSTLRTSLNFNKSIHGRAYGDGIYHAFSSQVSMEYTGGRYRIPKAHEVAVHWKNADMRVTSMLSVNEIVLDTSTFVSQTPYLVVNSPDKVQTRYLIIRAREGLVETVENNLAVLEPLKDVVYNQVSDEFKIYEGGDMFRMMGIRGATVKPVHVPKDSFTLSRNPNVPKTRPSTPTSKLRIPYSDKTSPARAHTNAQNNSL
jgi:hypothetical protein